MGSNLVFIYDGQCPFCNQFAELLELKSNLPGLQVKNAREYPDELPDGYDMDIKGAILRTDSKTFTGAEAIFWICSEIKNPSDELLRVLRFVFISNKRTHIIFPLLIWARRFTLFLKGVPRKLVKP